MIYPNNCLKFFSVKRLWDLLFHKNNLKYVLINLTLQPNFWVKEKDTIHGNFQADSTNIIRDPSPKEEGTSRERSADVRYRLLGPHWNTDDFLASIIISKKLC